MSSRVIGPVDTIWLNMDRPNNLMVIDTLVFFDGPADWDRMRPVLQDRLVDRYPVFRQRPVQPFAHLGLPRWEDDPGFDLERHLLRVELDPGADPDVALQRHVEQHMSTPLDRAHPLWQLHLVDGHPQGSVVYCRLHHALADGIALTRVLLSLTDATPEGDLEEQEQEQPERSSGGLLGGAVRTVGNVLRELPHLLDPHLVVDAFTQAQRTGAIANKLLLGPRAHTPFSGPPSASKRAVWSEPFPLTDVKAVGRLAGATVNDVLLAAVAGALSTYIAERGAEPADVATMVPVNVRPLDQPLPKELGNRFALVLFSYPSSVHSPFGRIAETKRRMDTIKHSPEVVLTFGLIRAIGRTGPELERFLVDFFAAKAIGVTTNVPGPCEDRYLAGSRISGLIGWVPESGDQTVGVSIFTYAGTVRVGFKVDAALVPDPENLVRAFEAEIDQLVRVAHAG